MKDHHGMTGARAAAEAFVHAIVWGEHVVVWELLSQQARRFALRVATSNGLDRVVAGRIEHDLADPTELHLFQAQVLKGLRRDLRSVDMDHLAVELPPHDMAGPPNIVTVTLTTPSIIPGTTHWVAGELELSRDESGQWRVDRLHPRLVGP